MTPHLVFVYNADTGVFNALADMAHKIFSPQTYACNLCAITHSNFGMRQEWREFIESLDATVEFLHADELRREHGIGDVALPAVFRKVDGGLEPWIGALEINECRGMEELKTLISEKMSLHARRER